MNLNFEFLPGNLIDINKIEKVDLEDSLFAVKKMFSEEWLQKEENNVIQLLWQRKERDDLATIELYSLGRAIRKLSQIDLKFIRDKVDLIKTDDPKNWNGAIFEIFALNAYSASNSVQPAKENQPGYDGEVLLKEGKAFRLSIKNYSISAHHKAFLLESEILRELVEKFQQRQNCPPLEIFVSKKGVYPTADDWKLLKDNIEGGFIEYNRIGKHYIRVEIGDWSIMFQRLISPDGELSQFAKSYTLIVSSPFHNNEEKNLFDKIEEACINLAKHEKTESTNLKNFVIIHLPKIASRQNCLEWTKKYFELYPNKPISAVVLYQPLVISDDEKKQTYISNGISIIQRDYLNEDFKDVLPVDLSFPIGRLEEPFVEHAIFIRESDTTAFKVTMKNNYVYQRGDHYYDAQKETKEIRGSITKVASGIFRHSVVELFGQHISFSGIFQPADQLDIL